MSRVVISACCSSSGVTGSGVPSYAQRSMPSSVPARSASSTTIWPRLAAGVLGVARRLAVQAQVGRGLLDQAVRLARDDERVLGQPDVERLTAAAQREQQLGRAPPRCAPRSRPIPRSSATVARNASSTVAPAASRRRDQRRDHLGVGGDLRRRPGAARAPEVGVVVDVAVERADDVGPLVAVELLLVQRVRVRLGDDPDARPPRVAEHHRPAAVSSASARCSSASSRIAARRTAMLSPSSPISAAAL